MENILIVGAGPTGLTAAIELFRRGYRPRVVDHKDRQSTLSRAVGINPHSLDLLEESGVTAKLLAAGYKVRQLQVHNAAGKIIGRLRMDLLPHRFNFLLALPQDKTETILHDRLVEYGGVVEYGTHAESIAIKHGAAHVTLSHKEHKEVVVFDMVIAADGAHSKLREMMQIPFEGYDYENLWGIHDFMCPDLPYDDTAAHLIIKGGRQGVGVLIKIGEKRYRAVASTEKALANIPGKFTVAETLAENAFRISIRQAATYQKDGVFLAGDAAHVHSPAGGRGMNLGIDDACDLARRVAEGTLDGYTGARHPAGREVLKLSEGLVHAVTATNPLAVCMRNTVLRLFSAFPVLQKPLLKRVAAVD